MLINVFEVRLESRVKTVRDKKETKRITRKRVANRNASSKIYDDNTLATFAFRYCLNVSIIRLRRAHSARYNRRYYDLLFARTLVL